MPSPLVVAPSPRMDRRAKAAVQKRGESESERRPKNLRTTSIWQGRARGHELAPQGLGRPAPFPRLVEPWIIENVTPFNHLKIGLEPWAAPSFKGAVAGPRRSASSPGP